MQTIIRVFTLILVFTASVNSMANEDGRTPAQMTDEEWDIINTAHGDYNECLQEKMIEFGATSDDPRIISDQVLEICSTILIKLNGEMDERGINKYFTQKYIYNMKNKSAQQLLRNLMMMIASRQQNQNNAEATGSDARPGK